MEDKNPKEIDLLDLLQSMGKAIGNFFKFLYDSAWWLIVFAVKNYILLAIFVGIGGVLGVIKISTASKGYKSSMIIRTNALRSYEMVDYFNELSEYISSSSEYALKLKEENLGFYSLTSSKIKSLKPHFFIDYWGDGTLDEIDLKDNHSKKDTLNIRDSLHLSLEAIVTDPIVFTQIAEPVKKYIDSNPFIIKANKVRLRLLSDELKRLNNEIHYLDSLQRFSYFHKADMAQLQFSPRSGLILGDNRQQLFHEDKAEIEAIKKKVELEYELHKEPTTIIKDFPVVTTEMESDYILIIKNMIVLFGLGYLILLLIYIFKRNYKKYADKV